jgi:hypothetical protein
MKDRWVVFFWCAFIVMAFCIPFILGKDCKHHHDYEQSQIDSLNELR